MGDKNDIKQYFNKKTETEDEGTEGIASTRLRSEDSSTSESPSSKRLLCDADDEEIILPDDAPFWVPMMFKALDRVNSQVMGVSLKFDNFTIEIEERIDKIQKKTDEKFDVLRESFEDKSKEQDTQISELTESVKFLSGAFESQRVC